MRFSRHSLVPPLVVVLLGIIGAVLMLAMRRLGLWGASALWGVSVVGAGLLLLRREWRQSAARRDQAQESSRLLEVQKMEAVGRLAGGLAHDLNNYLAAIRTHTEMIHDREFPRERVVRQTGSVLRTVFKASALVERLLTFSRRQSVRPEVLSLNDVVDGLGPMIQGTVGAGISVELDLEPDLGRVEIDLGHIEQALVNLVVNARDAMAEGGTLTIETANVASGAAGSLSGEAVRLSVSDTGHGIPPEVRERIFEPFFTTKAGVGSSGLGLATVYAVIEQAGGSLEVESSSSEGTRFDLYFPRSEHLLTAPYLPSAEREELHGHERILLVDDNEELASATRLLLESLGYSVTLETDPVRALERAARQAGRFDLVVTDVQMPAMSGRDLVKRLRDLSPLPAVYLSGYTELIEVRQAPGHDEAYFIKKPFPARALARAVRELLDGATKGAAE